MRHLFAAALLATIVGAQPPAPGSTIVVRAAHLISATNDAVTSPGVVVIRGDKILAVGGSAAVPADARVIDLGAATLLPGLIDLHTHLTSTGVHWEEELLKTTPGQAALHGAHNALITLMAGFTTCRDMGPTWPFTDIDLRKAIDEGVVPGPRLQVAGNYVSPTGGAGDARQFSIYVDVPIVRNLADGQAGNGYPSAKGGVTRPLSPRADRSPTGPCAWRGLCRIQGRPCSNDLSSA